MRRFLFLTVVAMFLGISLSSVVRAQGVDWGTARKQLKSEQKLERHALKVRQSNRKASWHARRVTKSERLQAGHQMARERRDLKEKQKDALQDMKDHQRTLSAMQRSYGR